MKTTSEIFQEVITTAQEGILLQNKLNNLKSSPIELPAVAPTNDVTVAELQTRIASMQADMKREKEIHNLELKIKQTSAKLDAFKWIVGESENGKS